MKVKISINPIFGWDESLQRYVTVSAEGEYWMEESEIPIRCDRSQQKAGKQATANETNVAGTYGAQAQTIGGPLVSQLQKQAANPTGFNPTDINNMLVQSQETAGAGGVTGEANLAAARTRNAGGFANALDEAARIKNRQLSQNALGIQNENARLKEQQRAAAQAQLGGIMGEDTRAQLEAMGLVPKSIGATVEAGKSGWLQNFNDTLTALSKGATAAFPKGLQG